MPVGLAMGGSKSTKDICAGYIRTYASMIVLMVTNVLFLKLILSALAAMPSGIMVLPWCLLVVGLAKTARKTDNLISRIGMNPAMTGDPLGRGRGLMMAAIAARTIISSAGKGGKMPAGNGKTSSGGKVPPNNTKGATAHTYNGNVHNNTGGTNVGGESAFGGNNQQTGYSSGGNSSSNANSSTSARFGSANYNSANQSGKGFSSTVVGGAGTGSKINTNRFGIQKEKSNTGAPIGTKAGASGQKNGTNQQIQKSKTEAKQGMDANRKNRFGSSANNGIKHNPNPMKQNGKVGANKLQNTKAPNGVKMQGPLNAKGVTPTNVRFGSEQRKVLRDDDILITKDEDDVYDNLPPKIIVDANGKRQEKKGDRFRWLSTNGSYENGTGIPSYIHIVGDITSDTLHLTEGPLKADVASYLSGGELFIGLTGVQNVGFLREVITELKPKRILECIDMDVRTNDHVRKAQAKIRAICMPLCEQYRAITWPVDQKGIDDYLLFEKLKRENGLAA